MSIEKKIVIKADVKASLSGMDKVVSDLENGLKNQKYDLSKNTGLAKLIRQYKEAKDNFDSLVGSGSVEVGMSDKAIKAGEKTVALYKQIGQAIKNLQGNDASILKSIFPENFSAKIDKGTDAIDNFFKKLNDKKLKNNEIANTTKDVNRLQTELNELKTRRLKIEVDSDLTKAKKDLQDFQEMRENLLKQVREKLTKESVDSSGKTKTQRLEEDAETKSSRFRELEKQESELQRKKPRELTSQEKGRITRRDNQLKDPVFKAEQEAARETLTRYAKERTQREQEKANGETDRREKRAMRNISDAELDKKIAQAQKQYDAVVAKRKRLEDEIEKIENAPKKEKEKNLATLATEKKKAKQEKEAAEKELENYKAQRKLTIDAADKTMEKFQRGESPIGIDQSDVQTLADINEELQKAETHVANLKNEKSFASQEDKDSRVGKKEHDLAAKQLQLEKFKNELQQLDKMTNIDEVFRKLEQLNIPTDGIERTEQGLENLKKDLRDLDSKTVEKIRQALEDMGISADQADTEVEELVRSLGDIDDQAKGIKQAEAEMEQLKDSFLQFFSIGNSIQLLKQTLQSAVNTIKELDAAMTETAVVTDFSVGDMWEKLPVYADEASKLGASIVDLYGATTLYYQQGLKTAEAMQVGMETVKMARVANMDAAKATQAMTAALRGFNMEIGEMDAKRVNDVYSELAAITAADTSQIAKAMTKTASIAAGANMEFETTAALLAQIIETTQEAPETAGTAMKTIVARFSEVKNLRNKNEFIGKDEEGEEINVNNIDKALRTVGISMKGFFEGTEGLDSVLLKLAEKWNTLDFETQRYIATTAAGSRQQSRFIAMMSDYGRTMELVDAASDSAGASQEQYEKTLESLESKLNKLKNAWNTFTMGLANDEVVKAGVSIITALLEGINKINDALSGGSGLRKSILSLGAAFGALKLGGGVLGALFDTAKDAAAGGGSISGEAFVNNFEGRMKDRFKGGRNFLKALVPDQEEINKLVSQPVAQAIQNIDFSAMSGSQKKGIVESLLEDFNNAGFGDKTDVQTDAGGIMTLKREDYIAEAQTFFDEGEMEKGIQRLDEYAQKCGKSFEMSEESAQRMTNSVSTGLAKATTAAAGLAAGLTLIGSILDKNGNKKGAEVFQVLATGATALAGILTVLPGLFQAIGVSISTIPIVGWIAAAITALITLGSIISNLVETSAERTERLTQASKDAKQAAEEASKAYDELLSKKNEYADTQSALEELIKGTEEWKRKLIEANNQVLTLLEAYPMLNRFLSRGKDGQLIITSEGFQELANLKLEQVSAANVASLGASTMLLRDRELAAREQLFEETMYKTIHAEQGNPYQIGDTQKELVLQKWLENPEIFFDEANAELRLLAEATEYTVPELMNMIDALRSYETTMTQIEAEKQSVNRAMLANIDAEAANSKYAEAVASGMAKGAKKQLYIQRGKYDTEEEIKGLAETLRVDSKYSGIITDVSGGIATYQQIYEALTGQVAKEEWTKDDLLTQIASIKAAEEQTGATERLIRSLDNFAKKNSEEADYISGLISGDINRSGVTTINELKNLLQVKTAQQVSTELGYDSKESFLSDAGYTGQTIADLDEETQAWYVRRTNTTGNVMSHDEVEAYIQEHGNEAVKAEILFEINQQKLNDQAKESLEKATAKVAGATGKTQEEITQAFGKYSIQTIENIGNQVSSMSKGAAKDYLETWQKVVSDSNLNADTSKQMANYLSTIDWSSMTQAVEAMDYMQSEDVDSKAIEEYWRVATEGSHTYITSLQEILNLTSKIQKKATDINELEKRLIEGEGTPQDLEDLINAGADIESFQMTPDGWYATEEAIKEATDKLKEYNAEQAAAIAEQQRREGEWATRVYENTDKGNFLHQLTTEDEDGKKTAGTITQTYQAIEIASLLGESQQGEKEDEAKFIERIQQAYENYVNLLNNGELYQVAADKAAAMAQAARFTTDAAAMQGHTEESVRYSMQAETKEEELDVQEVTAYADALGEIPGLEQVMADRIAIDNARMNKGVEDLASNYEAWAAEIEAGPGNPKYAESIKNLRKAADDLLGSTKGLSDEWLTNKTNMSLFEKAAKGDEKAIDELRKSAAKEFAASLNLEEFDKNSDIIYGLIDDMVAEDIEMGATLDTSEFASSLYDILVASGATVDQINEAFTKIGWEPEIKYKEVPFQSVNNTAMKDEQEILVADGYNEDGSPRYRKETVGAMRKATGNAQTMVRIPLLGNGTYAGSVKEAMLSSTTFSGKPKDTLSPGSAGGSKKGGSKKKDWKNPYDKHYNALEQINEALREREKLERRYQKLLEKQGTLATNLIANSEKELAVLRQERGLQQDLIEKRKVQIKEQLSKDGLSKYASATENEFGEIEVRINWDKINAIKDEEKGSKIEEGISKIEGWRDDINGAKDALDDIEDATEEIRSRGEDEYFDLETRIKDALVQAQQDEIDKLSEINNSINDTNARLLETMQYNLEQERQMRENDKTEQELEDKQRRLEYLSQDTSGANALEIKQLEEEIAEGQQDYTDTLIDQKISELQHQNDIAAEQRQRQIDIAQSQLDHWVNTGGIWSDVYKLMDTGIGADGGIKIGSELQKLLLSEENYNSLSTLDKVKWGKELATTAAQAVHWLKVGNSTESLIASKELKAGQSITFKTSDGKTLTGKLSSNGDIVAGGKTYKDVHRNYDGNYMTDEAYQGQVQQPSKAPASTSSSNDTGNGTIKVGGKINAGKAKIYDSYDDNSGEYQYFSDDPIYNVLEEKNGRIRVRHHSRQSGTTGWFKKSEVKAYKTGGLADFTGPAWLDGTKSRPELVLNAKDTQNFIQLKNILGSLMSNTSKTTENSGDSTYDIDINVERISSDYDVEQMAEKIKDLINQDARYRNNNIAGLMR